MERLTINEIAEAVSGEIVYKIKDDYVENITIDSRKIEDNSLFIAIQGEKFDGHNFVEDVIKNGVKAIIVSDDIVEKKVNTIKVKDTKEALRALAAYYIKKLGTKVVGVTGSVGKTSTKDMIYGVLDKKFRVLKTLGNFNNDIGLPLTIFRLNKNIDIAVLEMGMSSLGEIDTLASIAKPEVAVISNIGVSHIENLKTRENILKAKMEITSYFKDYNVLFVNGDNDMLQKLDKTKFQFCIKSFGIEDETNTASSNDIVGYDIIENGEDGVKFKVKTGEVTQEIVLSVLGIHNVYNALAAIGIGLYFKMDITEIIEGLKNYEVTGMRQEIIKNSNIKIINDTYNASTQSMQSALNILNVVEGVRKIAVLGDMLELGDISESEHEKVGAYVKGKMIDILITRGKMARFIAKGAEIAGFKEANIISNETNEECIDSLKNLVKQGDVILVKGSRGMKMEKIVEFLKELTF